MLVVLLLLLLVVLPLVLKLLHCNPHSHSSNATHRPVSQRPSHACG